MYDLFVMTATNRSMFPLQRSGELCFKIFSNPNHPDPKTLQDDPVAQMGQVLSVDSKKMIRWKNGEESGSECSRKRRRREVEKQRRQEMATLFSGLRSLLPPQFIRGKRSISDHMYEAVKYITHLQSNMKDLEAKRNGVQRSCNPKCVDSISSLVSAPKHSVIVQPWSSRGTQILITRRLNERVFPLSIVMELLSQQGLNIVSCLSTQGNHKIYCEASEEMSPTNLVELRNKLEEVISYIF